MGKMYSDSRYGVEKILTFAKVDLTLAAGNGAQMIFTEDIVITELGFMYDTITTLTAGIARTLELRESSVVLATLTIPTGKSIGDVSRQTTIGSANEISSGDTLVVYRNVTGYGAGAPYIKYKERYV